MKQGKYEGQHSRKRSAKPMALLLALVLVLGVAAGDTIAWLTDSTSEVKNTFTTSDIDIELKESENLDLQMVPGYTITKDPTVTVEADSEKCYVFVKVEKSTNFDSFMTYIMADGWTDLTDVPNVYYRVVNDTSADQTFAVIKDNTVSVKTSVTKSDMDDLTTSTYPTLTVTAYACQYYKSNTATESDTNGTPFTPAEAWANVNPASSGT